MPKVIPIDFDETVPLELQELFDMGKIIKVKNYLKEHDSNLKLSPKMK